MQVLQRLQARRRRMCEQKVRVCLGCVTQALVDGRDPHRPDAERIGLARLGRRELARLGPAGRRGLGQQGHHVKPYQRGREQILAPADLAPRQLPGRLELRCAALPLALGHGQRGLDQVDARALQALAQCPRAREIAAKQQRLGQAASQLGRHHRRQGVSPCQQPVFERLGGRLGEAAQDAQHVLSQLGLQCGFEPAEQLGVEGLQHRHAQRAAPQMGEAVGQLAQAVQVAEFRATEDHQPQRRSELVLLLKAERIGAVEVAKHAPGVEPGSRLGRVQHHFAEARLGVRRDRANPPQGVARGVAGGQQPVGDAAYFRRIELAAALGAQAGRRHHFRHPRHAGGRLQRAQCVVHQRVFAGHREVVRGDVAHAPVNSGGARGTKGRYVRDQGGLVGRGFHSGKAAGVAKPQA